MVSIPTSNSKKTAPNCARKKISLDTGKLFSTLNKGPKFNISIPPKANGDMIIPATNSPNTWGIFINLTATLFAKRKGLCYKHGHV